jgi:hypothetical protein
MQYKITDFERMIMKINEKFFESSVKKRDI